MVCETRNAKKYEDYYEDCGDSEYFVRDGIMKRERGK